MISSINYAYFAVSVGQVRFSNSATEENSVINSGGAGNFEKGRKAKCRPKKFRFYTLTSVCVRAVHFLAAISDNKQRRVWSLSCWILLLTAPFRTENICFKE